jgi:putative DNA primase/helicase
VAGNTVDRELYTDLGNAQKFVAENKDQIRYCPTWGRWLVWDGQRWKIDETGEVVRRAKKTVLALLDQARKNRTDAGHQMAFRHAKGSQRLYSITALVKLAESEKDIPVLPDELDSDPYLLNCLNGTVDLRTGELHPHRKYQLITKLAPLNYDANARCPIFEQFTNRIMGGDPALVGYLQRCLGYALTGDVTEKALFLFLGKGNNGKTTLVEAFRHVLGDYAGQLPIESLMAKNSDSIPNDIARLKGLRFVTASEVESGRRLNEAKVKLLTGMGTLTGRFMRQEFFDFVPTFKIFMDTNHKPDVRDTDEAIWDRLKVIPFKVPIPPEEKDKHLLDRLKAEAPGILAWAIRGCMDWWEHHDLAEPAAVKEASRAYRQEMDSVADFVDAECIRDANLSETSTALYREYKGWCQSAGEIPQTQKALGTRLGELGFTQGKVGGQRGWLGIGLKAKQSPPGTAVGATVALEPQPAVVSVVGASSPTLRYQMIAVFYPADRASPSRPIDGRMDTFKAFFRLTPENRNI